MKRTILQTVQENEALLKSLKTHTELREWAVLQGWDNRSAFPKFKTALNAIGLDYDVIKSGVKEQNSESINALVKSGKELTLEEMAAYITANHTPAKAWSKDGKKRIYLSNAGHNTNKMRTLCYIGFADGDCYIACYVDCQSQPTEWCVSQADIVKEQYSELVDVCREHCELCNVESEVEQ